MDFTPELSAFQGAIISADNVHQFSRLSSKGGNEENIKYVLDCMLRFLKGEKYVNENGFVESTIPKARKFALYIVLNADLPILEQMVDMEGIDLVLWTVPTIPKHLMCEMLWNLHMEQFVYEIILYCDPQLALEVLGAFIDNFKYFHPVECLQKLRKLSASCYFLICTLHCFETDDLSSKLTIALEHLQKILKYFITPPNSYKLNALSKDELYKYKGKCLHSALSLLYDCFSQFTQKISHCVQDLYQLTYKAGTYKASSTTYNLCDSPNNLILECLHNSNILLLDVSKELVMDVSVDVFCAWSEFEENHKSMQQTIGELCDKVRTKLLSIESVCEHPIISMIEQISRKPTEINDIINTLDSQTIIDNINKNGEDKTSWVRALTHKDKLYEHPDLIKALESNLEVFSEDEYYKLYDMLKNYITMDTTNSQSIKSLLLNIFQHCKLSDKHKILKETFNNSCFCDMTDDTEFLNTITEIFNRFIVSVDSDLTDVLTVFLQNPKQVFTKIFASALESIHQTHIMLEVMKLLQDYSNYYYSTETEPCIISVTKNIFEQSINTETQRDNFIKFICGLKNIDIIPGVKLLLLIIMPSMHKALLSKDINAVNVQIRLLHDAYTMEELLDCRAPMLAMLAQVMDVVRWRNITTFVPEAPATLHLTIQLQTSLLHTFDGVVPDKESNWLKTKLPKLQPLNMYYYRILWNPPGKNFFEVISRKDVRSDTDASELPSLLTQILCCSTQQEWCEFWDDLSVIGDTKLLNVFYEAVAMVTVAEAAHRTDATRACIMYCYRNLVYVTRYKFFKEPLSDTQVMAAVGNLASLLKHVQAADVEETSTLLMPLLAYLSENKSTLAIDLSKCLNNHFSNTHFIDIVKRVFAI